MEHNLKAIESLAEEALNRVVDDVYAAHPVDLNRENVYHQRCCSRFSLAFVKLYNIKHYRARSKAVMVHSPVHNYPLIDKALIVDGTYLQFSPKRRELILDPAIKKILVAPVGKSVTEILEAAAIPAHFHRIWQPDLWPKKDLPIY